MTEAQFGITKATPSLPRDLLRVPHKEGVLVLGSPAFGPNIYRANLEQMQKHYPHSKEQPKISFRPATTSESISAVAYDFGNAAKPQIFDKKWLQAGWIVRTSEGVFTNTQETNEDALRKMLARAEKVNGIFLLDEGIAFAPYETFETGVQELGKFAESGLARVLEHTKEKIAPKLREISSGQHYRSGVNVWGFDPVKEPILRVARLSSNRDVRGGRLLVGGYDWGVNYGDGFAFGVLNETAEGGSPGFK